MDVRMHGRTSPKQYAVLTLMVFTLLLCSSSPNFPFCCFVFDINQSLKVKFVIYYVMTKLVLMNKFIA